MARGKELEPSGGGGGLAIPDDIRADLIRAQGESLEGASVDLPEAKIMGAGAGLFEFTDTGDTLREFRGVVLNSHQSNVLWDRKFGDEAPEGEEGPACASQDGRHGSPRPGFAHAALPSGDVATGAELIECAGCPYNQWGSQGLLPHRGPGKGKAVTNQRVVYVLMENREFPVRLTLPPTSIKGWDNYLAGLSNQGMPVQSVVTTFVLERIEKGSVKYSVCKFGRGPDLDQSTFERVLEKRRKYHAAIHPPVVQQGAPGAARPGGGDSGEDDDDLPF